MDAKVQGRLVADDITGQEMALSLSCWKIIGENRTITNLVIFFLRTQICTYDVSPPSGMFHNLAEQSSLPEAIRFSL